MNMSLFIYNVNVIGHQDGFQFFTFMNSGAMNILVDMSWCMFTHSSTGIYIRMKNLLIPVAYLYVLIISSFEFFSCLLLWYQLRFLYFILWFHWLGWWTEKPGGLHSMWSQKVGHDWACTHSERKESPFHVIINFHFYMSHSKVNFYQLGTFSVSLSPNTHTQYPHLYHLVLYWANWNF